MGKAKKPLTATRSGKNQVVLGTPEKRRTAEPAPAAKTAELERALDELQEANQRLVTVGVRMQELADEAERARDEAQAANRAKDEFLATLSHELRTPLNAIVGWVHILRRGDAPADVANRALEIIERNAILQTSLIAELLQVSQIITGKIALQVEPVELASLIHASIDTVRPAAEAKSIRIETQVEPAVPLVLADTTRVQQLLWNVLSNAIKFTPDGGEIVVTVEQVESSVEIAIRDSGLGIEPSFLPHVFDRFRQADPSMRRAFGGLGLGLAIVRHLMELHGGTARAESPGLGRGSTFTLSFPVAALTSSQLEVQRNVAPSLPALRVLVVEDDPDSRALMEVLLTSSGAEVTAVASVREAVAHVHEHRPDLMIADIGLPDEDGYELIRQVRILERHGRTHLPAVALTAYAQPADAAKALAAGFELHLTKPIRPTQFIQAIAELWQVVRTTSQVREL